MPVATLKRSRRAASRMCGASTAPLAEEIARPVGNHVRPGAYILSQPSASAANERVRAMERTKLRLLRGAHPLGTHGYDLGGTQVELRSRNYERCGPEIVK